MLWSIERVDETEFWRFKNHDSAEYLAVTIGQLVVEIDKGRHRKNFVLRHRADRASDLLVRKAKGGLEQVWKYTEDGANQRHPSRRLPISELTRRLDILTIYTVEFRDATHRLRPGS